jgi:hypothetical protein
MANCRLPEGTIFVALMMASFSGLIVGAGIAAALLGPLTDAGADLRLVWCFHSRVHRLSPNWPTGRLIRRKSRLRSGSVKKYCEGPRKSFPAVFNHSSGRRRDRSNANHVPDVRKMVKTRASTPFRYRQEFRGSGNARGLQ